ncbi:hypothetical protein C1I89_29900 [Achromobacter pulmonis]|uniref:Uncharacterized protein n=1 Tax=Achromobacter pulmonis TaxID=1389932 RepID=A0A2N8K9P6_9BURK|nr:hypothetical protein [Achromobacter pulmonis]PND30184.1 hypothetical protein C1I89_29900 [Achromobacter pulmonis]
MMAASDDTRAAPRWQDFALVHGWRAARHELAAVLGVPADAVEALRRTGACTRLAQPHDFPALFALWHGRPPVEDDWPAPRKAGHGGYEWQAPELALLASLVGQVGIPEIAQVLTARLRERTGDAGAERSATAVQVRTNLIGLQSSDVLGGITVADAGREAGSTAVIHQAIRKGTLAAHKTGRLLVIPHDAWAAWKTQRSAPPEGHVRLATLRQPLGIRSDKLSEFARMGYVPGAVRCNPFGARGPSTQYGTWYIDPQAADRLVADRRAGRPMPWHGKPLLDNLRITYRLWQQRRHPPGCRACAEIWGEQGAPADFDDYLARYPALAQGAKRHLTMPWSPGLTVAETAAQAGRSPQHVRRAIANGVLAASPVEGVLRVTRTDATRWIARHCPSGDGEKSWIAVSTACRQYLFTERELRQHIAGGRLRSKVGTEGAMRGIEYVPRQQCAQLRETQGFTEEEAARRVGVSVERLRALLDGLAWRQAEGIPLATVQAAIKRRDSQEGHTLEEAAELLGVPLAWVKARKRDGTVRVSQVRWDRRRQYLSAPMLERLREALRRPAPQASLPSGDWLRLGDAALEAGVSAATIQRWANDGELERREAIGGHRYHREAVRARARRYWVQVRFHRARPPAWLAMEGRARMPAEVAA